jgi:hypothetical protein
MAFKGVMLTTGLDSIPFGESIHHNIKMVVVPRCRFEGINNVRALKQQRDMGLESSRAPESIGMYVYQAYYYQPL